MTAWWSVLMYLIVGAASLLLALSIIATLVLSIVSLTKVVKLHGEVKKLSDRSAADGALTQEERAMLDGFRGLDAEKKKALIQTAHSWRNSN